MGFDDFNLAVSFDNLAKTGFLQVNSAHNRRLLFSLGRNLRLCRNDIKRKIEPEIYRNAILQIAAYDSFDQIFLA